MDPLLLLLSLGVFVIAFSYSSVGLGGGSSYTALLTIVGFSYAQIPSLSLVLNIIVTIGATIQFARHGHLKWKVLMPFVLTSIPGAYLGGSLAIGESLFYWILLGSLIAVAARIYLWQNPVLNLPKSKSFQLGLSLILGLVLGFIAGTVGIGGGIYLVPLIVLTGIATEKVAAATGAAFILINSVVGLAARMSWVDLDMNQVLPMGLSVLVGGVLGSHYGAGRWRPQTLQKVLGGIVLVAIALLARKVF